VQVVKAFWRSGSKPIDLIVFNLDTRWRWVASFMFRLF